MSRRKGDTAPAKLRRQHLVCRLFLRGLTVPEVARQLDVTERTIQYDIQEIRMKLSQIVEARTLRTLQHAHAQWNELWRQGWVLFTRKPPLNEKGTPADDRFIKLACLDRLIRVADAMDTLTGLRGKAADKTILLESKHPLRIERLTFEEQLQRGVEELENNEGLRRAEGLLD